MQPSQGENDSGRGILLSTTGSLSIALPLGIVFNGFINILGPVCISA